eukprot:353286-Chlamydomonas_euryale.AAC.1
MTVPDHLPSLSSLLSFPGPRLVSSPWHLGAGARADALRLTRAVVGHRPTAGTPVAAPFATKTMPAPPPPRPPTAWSWKGRSHLNLGTAWRQLARSCGDAAAPPQPLTPHAADPCLKTNCGTKWGGSLKRVCARAGCRLRNAARPLPRVCEGVRV